MGSTRWSDRVAEGEWVVAALAPFGSPTITSIVPAGFEAYARVLHPCDAPHHEPGVDPWRVRWAEVAAWGGVPLEPGVHFWQIAVPDPEPSAPPPDGGAGPRTGSLATADASALSRILAEHTASPEDCWCGLWHGYGYGWTEGLPDAVRDGPMLVAPQREYWLYRTPVVEVATSLPASWDQTPNLWWPADRAWCVATEVDLRHTYVGGSRALVDQLLAAPDLEVLATSPDEPPFRMPPPDWLASRVDPVAAAVVAGGEATLAVAGGTLTARLDRTGAGPTLSLEIRRAGSGVRNAVRVDATRQAVADQLRATVLSLVGR